MLATAAWTLLLAGVGLATRYVYATKEELSQTAAAATAALTAHATAEAKVTADLATETAVHHQALEQHDKALEKLERFVEAVDANVRTMMIEAEIPPGRIKRPKEQ